MKGLWKVNAPVDTGSYRDSVRVERTAPTRENHRMVRVRAGGYVTNPKTGRKVDYAGYLEAKYHCGENAYNQVKGNIASLIQRRVVEACNK